MAEDKHITLGQLKTFAAQADARLDALEAGTPRGQSVMLAASGWTNDSGDDNYPYQYKLAVDGITTASRADIVLDAASAAAASESGVSTVTETTAGTVILRAREAPTAALTGTLYVTKSPR